MPPFENPEAADLRRRAEALSPEEAGHIQALSPGEIGRMLHDLRVHQIELEMQNEELRRAHTELDAVRARYFDLYDLAPVGYCTLGEQGIIMEINLTAAGLLGAAKTALARQPLSRFIHPDDHNVYYRLRKQLSETGEPQACDLRMMSADGRVFWAHLEANGPQESEGVLGARIAIHDITGRKQAEIALRQSEEKHRSVLLTAMDGFWIVDTGGRLREVNDAYCRMSGYSAGELLAMCISDLEFSETAAETRSHIQRIVDRGEDRFISRHRRKDGTVFDVEVAVQHRPDNPGTLVAFLRDITERKRAEALLLESEEKYRSLFECNCDAVLLASPDGRVFSANPQACSIFGRTEAEICRLGRPHLVDLADPHLSNLLVERERTGRMRGEVTLLRADGARFPADVSSAVYKDGGGNAQACLTVRDITERRQAEDRLRESEARLKMAEGLAHVGSSSWDVDTDTSTWSEELYHIAGMDPRDPAPGRAVCAPCTPESGARLNAALEVTLATGEPYDLELDVVRPDGSRRRARALGAAVRDERGRINRLFGSVQDITEQKRAELEKASLEAQLTQSQKLESIGRLAGGVAHDFNNILTVINGYAALLSRELPDGNGLRAWALEIATAGNRAAGLTSQLLALGRKQVLRLTATNLNTVVADALRTLGPLLGTGIELAARLTPHLGAAMVDPDQIHQVILNLAANARDAMPGGGRIEFSTSEVTLDEAAAATHPDATAGRYVRLTVADNGTGMSEEVRGKAFEPFFTTKAKGQGTGLGLAIVHGIVRQSGGWLDVQSTPGRGSSFTVYLPRIDSAIVVDEVKPIARDAGPGKETVLLVEDEPAVRRLTKTLLKARGYHVLEAGNAADAHAVANGHPGEIHLLLTDLVMPGINGRVLSEQLRALRPNLRVVLMSGYAEDILDEHSVGVGGLVYIQKPFRPDALAAKIRDVLNSRKPAN